MLFQFNYPQHQFNDQAFCYEDIDHYDLPPPIKTNDAPRTWCEHGLTLDGVMEGLGRRDQAWRLIEPSAYSVGRPILWLRIPFEGVVGQRARQVDGTRQGFEAAE